VTATTVPAHGIDTRSAPGFGATLRSEWTKLRSLRSTWIITGLAMTLSIGFSALMALVAGLTFDSWGDGAQASFDPVLGSTPGLLFSLILLIVLGVTAITSEYSTGMIRTTFIVNPRRVTVLLAKATIVGALGIVISAVALPGMFLVSQVIFAAYDLPSASISDSDAIRFVLLYVTIAAVVHTWIPLSIAALLRGAASAITVSIALFFLPGILTLMLPVWMQENVLRYLPVMSLDSLAGIIKPHESGYVGETLAIFLLAFWLIAFLVTAAIVLRRRDA
jgi:ABC-2 type transport system permease protein